MSGIVLWRWMLKSFLFFSKVDSSQYRNTFSQFSIWDKGYKVLRRYYGFMENRSNSCILEVK
jgi:hypothetical protein